MAHGLWGTGSSVSQLCVPVHQRGLGCSWRARKGRGVGRQVPSVCPGAAHEVCLSGRTSLWVYTSSSHTKPHPLSLGLGVARGRVTQDQPIILTPTSEHASPLLPGPHGWPNHSGDNPRSLTCGLAPAYFFALCPHLSLLLLKYTKQIPSKGLCTCCSFSEDTLLERHAWPFPSFLHVSAQMSPLRKCFP